VDVISCPCVLPLITLQTEQPGFHSQEEQEGTFSLHRSHWLRGPPVDTEEEVKNA
jgi:hypothetical protein